MKKKNLWDDYLYMSNFNLQKNIKNTEAKLNNLRKLAQFENQSSEYFKEITDATKKFPEKIQELEMELTMIKSIKDLLEKQFKNSVNEQGEVDPNQLRDNILKYKTMRKILNGINKEKKSVEVSLSKNKNHYKKTYTKLEFLRYLSDEHKVNITGNDGKLLSKKIIFENWDTFINKDEIQRIIKAELIEPVFKD